MGLNKERFSKPKLRNTIPQDVLGGHKLRPLVKIEFNQHFASEFIKNEDSTYDHPNDTVPSSLLRHFFRNQGELSNINIVKDWEKWKYIICNLEFTCYALSSSIIDFKKYFRWNAASGVSDYMYGIPEPKIFEIHSSDTSEFLIVKALLVRIEFGHRLMRYFHEEEQSGYEFASQLFIDTHLDIMCWILNNYTFDDNSLRNIGRSQDDLLSPLAKNYPNDNRFPYCGDLPDFTTCSDLGNIWFDVRPRRKDLISSIIHTFCSKTMKHKCSKRNFLRILIDKYSKDFPVLNETYKMIIEVSLMGNYPHANFRTSFLKRIQIRNEFHHIKSFDDTDHFNNWMRENEPIIVCITKEFHMHIITSQHALDVKMEESKNWKDIKIICIRTMDMIRSMLSNYRLHNFMHKRGDDKEEVFGLYSRIKDRLSVLEQKMSVLLDKLKKCNFLNLMLSYIEKFYQTVIVEKKSTVSVGNDTVLGQDIMAAIDKVAMYVAVRYDNFVPTRYLKCFGITEESYEDIRDFYFRYEAMNTPDNSVKMVLETIHKRSVRDFFIIRAYLQAIRKYRCIEVYPFTQEQYDATMHSIRIKRRVEPWNPLEEHHTRSYFCTVCNKWAHPVVDPNSITSVVNIFSLGKEKVSRDPESKKLYCGKQVTSITIKNLIESNAYFYKGEIEDEGVAKAIRTHKSTFNCSTAPLMHVVFPGRIVSINGKKWSACSICTQPTIFEGAKFGTNGFTCCFHEKPPMKKKKMSNNALPSISKDPLVNARNELGFNYGLDLMNYCIYCGKLSDKETSQQIRVIDNDTYAFSKAILCSSDYEMVKDSINVDNIMYRNQLFDLLGDVRTKLVTGLVNKQRKRKA